MHGKRTGSKAIKLASASTTDSAAPSDAHALQLMQPLLGHEVKSLNISPVSHTHLTLPMISSIYRRILLSLKIIRIRNQEYSITILSRSGDRSDAPKVPLPQLEFRLTYVPTQFTLEDRNIHQVMMTYSFDVPKHIDDGIIRVDPQQ